MGLRFWGFGGLSFMFLDLYAGLACLEGHLRDTSVRTKTSIVPLLPSKDI